MGPTKTPTVYNQYIAGDTAVLPMGALKYIWSRVCMDVQSGFSSSACRIHGVSQKSLIN